MKSSPRPGLGPAAAPGLLGAAGMDDTARSFARNYAADELLRDGGSIHIRAIRPEDRERLLRHFRKLSPTSVYFRFLGAKKDLTAEELARFTEVDFVRHVALAATLGIGEAEEFIGVGRYIVTDPNHPERAEVAFAVLDEHQGRGIGTVLLEHLARIARMSGVVEFEADTLGGNRKMLEVFARSGFEVKRTVSEGLVHVTFPTAETDRYLDASLARQRIASAQSVRPFLAPRAVAVVGASRRPDSIGNAIVSNLLHGGFTGKVYPVNPRAETVEGLPAHPSVQAIGAPVDLAVIAVPAQAVEGAVRDCAAAGVRAVVVISSGFAEASAEGREAQQRLVSAVRACGMRLVGPNCMGVLNTDPAVSMNATFAPVFPPPGNIGMLSQSGALGLAILDCARSRGIGLSSFVSVGNKADVSGNDLLSYWSDDPRTQVIVLYLESFGNPRKFSRLAPAVARTKPIVAVKAGRTAAGVRAASSHSAALANLDVAVDALFEQAGVIRTETIEGLFDVVSLLASQPVPEGRRVGVVTNAGGPAILLADTCEARGLALPELSASTRERLQDFLPAQAGLRNPVDMLASAGEQDYAHALEAVGNDPAIDSVIAIYVPPRVTRPEEIATGIARGAGAIPPTKPVLAVFLSSAPPPPALHRGPRGRLPVYAFPENAAIALSAAVRYGEWRRRPRGVRLRLEPAAVERVRGIVERTLARAGGAAWLSPADSASVLEACGIAFAPAVTVEPDAAPSAAERLGFPLVAKVVAPGILHKSDVGGVILGLRSPTEVASAVGSLRRRVEAAGSSLEGVVLQREVPGGVEALVGVARDPTFGPLLVCGLGGVAVEVLRDVSFRLTPVTDLDAEEMIDRLRSRRLLDGYRGSPPADRAALVDTILRVSALVEAAPEIAEVDLNPVKVLEPGRGAVVVDGRIRVAPAAEALDPGCGSPKVGSGTIVAK